MNHVALPTHPSGVYYGVPNEVYQAGPQISNSKLLTIAKSPAHFFGCYLDPLRPPPDDKAPDQGQLIGTMAHCALLEPAEFHARFIVGPDVRRGTKIWDAFEAGLKAGQTGCKRKDADTALAIARRMRAVQLDDSTFVRDLLAKGQPEVSAYWDEQVVIDNDTGEVVTVPCRVRPDWVHDLGDGTVIVIDAKTCPNAHPEEFTRQIARMWYHHQAAFYMYGFEKASGKRVREFIFVQGEVAWPHVSSACMVDQRDLEGGATLFKRNLVTYAQCMHSGEWPGYTKGIALVSLPAYARKQ